MIDFQTLMLFSLAAFALTVTPGPDMVLIASRTAAQGRVAGFATWAGIAMGTYCHALAAALGLSQLFLMVPVAYDVVRYVGAGYLLFLAYKTITASNEVSQTNKFGRALSTATMFRQGVLTNILNPKMALFILALFPQFVNPANGAVALQIMVLATILNVIGLFSNGVVILTTSKLSSQLSSSGRFKALSQYVLATVFAGLAVRLMIQSKG